MANLNKNPCLRNGAGGPTVLCWDIHCTKVQSYINTLKATVYIAKRLPLANIFIMSKTYKYIS